MADKTVTNRYGIIHRGQKHWLGTKNLPFWEASIADGVPPAALLVGQKPEPTSIGIEKEEDDNMRKRNTTIAIRCTEEESKRIHELAERHGLKLNDFVMRCALSKKIVVANGIDEIVRQQKAIGRNLNQIATLANMDRLTVVNFQPLLDEHRKVTELIGQLLREVK
ncbi:MAG TPA: plasmid mobilization relaxosome protein MobC [Ruminococcus sp.]|nr:plasmid mobilization relaxosome protein MobC [Ruminococcus sp.]